MSKTFKKLRPEFMGIHCTHAYLWFGYESIHSMDRMGHMIIIVPHLSAERDGHYRALSGPSN